MAPVGHRRKKGQAQEREAVTKENGEGVVKGLYEKRTH